MTTTRTTILTSDQVRAVLVGLGANDDGRRVLAFAAMADALTAADEPVPAVDQAVDPERERRVDALVAAVGQMLGQYGQYGAYSEDSPLMNVMHDAFTALTTYSRPSAPAPAEPAPAPMSGARAELAAARVWVYRLDGGHLDVELVGRLCRAVTALDALDGPGGAA